MSLVSNYVTIGVSGARPDSHSMCAMIGVLEAAGITPHCLYDHGIRCVDSDLARMDALIFMGNDYDIDPTAYIHRYAKDDPRACIHAETKSERASAESCARGKYEDALMQKALKAGVPILGICGGMQRLNVLCGGTLHQHIPDMVGHDRHWQSRHGIAPNVGSISIQIPAGTLLSKIASDRSTDGISNDCTQVIMENSLRHQSVDMLGDGLRICSISDVEFKDGSSAHLVEAIEATPGGPYAQQFLLGVQWHPEFSASFLGERIIKHLILAAQDFAGARGDISFI